MSLCKTFGTQNHQSPGIHKIFNILQLLDNLPNKNLDIKTYLEAISNLIRSFKEEVKCLQEQALPHFSKQIVGKFLIKNIQELLTCQKLDFRHQGNIVQTTISIDKFRCSLKHPLKISLPETLNLKSGNLLLKIFLVGDLYNMNQILGNLYSLNQVFLILDSKHH